MNKILGIIIVLVILVAGYFVYTNLASWDVYETEEDPSISLDEEQDAEEVFLYAEEVESAEDCTEFEEFDPETSECFFECASEEECEATLDKIDAAIDEFADEYSAFSENFKEFEGDSAELADKIVASFTVRPGETMERVSGEPHPNDDKVIGWFKAVSPDRFSDTYINRVILYNDPGADAAAFVEPSRDAPKWDMYVNVDTFQDGEKEMVFTIIHEFAHILTLNESQMDLAAGEDNCPTYYTQEGCLRELSYLGQFFQNFWWNSFTRDRNQFAVEGKDYYGGNEKSFVSEYAATNPGEDIAETFAQFVLGPRSEMSEREGILGRKINFFYEFPELVEIRNSVRTALTPFARARLR